MEAARNLQPASNLTLGLSSPAAAPSSEKEPPSGTRLRTPNDDPGPYSDEPQMETHVHMMQVVMLLTCLQFLWKERKDYFASGNLSIYYPIESPRTGEIVRRKLAFRGPDFFVVLGARHKPRRNSWVVENEDGKYPDLIVEVLSTKTRSVDRGKKKAIYEKIFRTPEYFLFDPVRIKLEGYRLVKGAYEPIAPDAAGRLHSERLGVSFGLHDMPELEGKVARLFTPDGELVPTPVEAAIALVDKVDREAKRAARESRRAEQESRRAEQESRRAEQESRRAEQESQRAEQESRRAEQAEQEKERLAAKLRELGVDPASLGGARRPARRR